jgi:hypothetical protein
VLLAVRVGRLSGWWVRRPAPAGLQGVAGAVLWVAEAGSAADVRFGRPAGVVYPSAYTLS